MAIPEVDLTPQGHVILMTYIDSGGYVDALIKTGDLKAPFVIARNFDIFTGTWGGGSYYSTLTGAFKAWMSTYGGE